MKREMICVIYVDDIIFAGPDNKAIDEENKLLGRKHDDDEQPLEFHDEGELSAFLGIKIENKTNNEYYLCQPGLIEKVLSAAEMNDCNPNTTPGNLERLGPDKDEEIMNESWKYASVIGMLMYVANNTRPDIAHAVHATSDKGMTLKPNYKQELDYFIDIDSAGSNPVYPDQDPSSTKSWTGYVILYQGCPLL